MPVIKLWCLPPMGEKKLRKVHLSVVQAVVSIKELGLTSERDMTTLFPTDMMQYGLGTEIIIEVSGLFAKPNRSEDLRGQLAKRLGRAVHGHFPEAYVECFVEPYVNWRAFWCSRPSR